MKFLFLSNYFPPHTRGGYEQWCEEVALALTDRGHEVSVITARPEAAEKRRFQVFRVLEPEVVGGTASTVGRFLKRKSLENANLDQTRRVIDQTRPDAAMIWGMWNIPRSVPALVEALLPDRTAYYFCDYWPSLPNAMEQQLEAPATRRITGIPKQLLARLIVPRIRKERRHTLELRKPIFVSEAIGRLLGQSGVRPGKAEVIYGGTQVEQFTPNRLLRAKEDPLRLVYLGRLTADKGVHTALRALRILSGCPVKVCLDIYGGGDEVYEKELRAFVQSQGLTTTVRFCGGISRAQVPDILSRYHALVFPSEWEEPFARTVLEAMAAGLLVIGTTTGGTPEILRHRETGLAFRAGQAEELAGHLESVAREPQDARKLADVGRKIVVQQFTLTRMVDHIEQALGSMVNPSLVLTKQD
ncbi:MAG: glycosyltransferase family 1 protein [Acidobacteria bacterium]|nr:MAG: glycosyltransferase family 1 protein [Acidobacteriota bacterium]